MSERRVLLGISLLIIAVAFGLLAWRLTSTVTPSQPVPLEEHQIEIESPKVAEPKPAIVPEKPTITPTVVESLTPPPLENPPEVAKDDAHSVLDRVERHLNEAERMLDRAETDLDLGE